MADWDDDNSSGGALTTTSGFGVCIYSFFLDTNVVQLIHVWQRLSLQWQTSETEHRLIRANRKARGTEKSFRKEPSFHQNHKL